MSRPLKEYRPAKKKKLTDGKFRILFTHPSEAQFVVNRWGRRNIWGRICCTDMVEPKKQFFEDFGDWDGTDKMGNEIFKREYPRMWREYNEELNSRPRKKNAIQVPYPHRKQRTIIYDVHRFKVMVCGRRFGKTTAALIAALDWAVRNPGHIIFYVAPFRTQAKSIAWKLLDEYVGQAYKRRNEQELMFELLNGSQIYLKGADNPDSLRGTKVHFCILDEYADIKPNVWSEILRPQTADTRGHAWFLGTPRGYDHFYELWHDVYEGKKGKDWIAFRLTTYDNPHVPREEIEMARAEEDERAFAQEYMAEFVQFEGLVYSDFFRGAHIKEFDISKIEGVDIVGVDFGADHPTASVFVRLANDGNVYVYDEFYKREVTAEDVSKECKKKEKLAGNKVRKRYLDPSAKGFSQELHKEGYRTDKAVNDRSFGIQKIRALLRAKKLVIHSKCTNLIYEFEHHKYKAVKERKGSVAAERDVDRSVLKVDDDALDALRYALSSHFKRTSSGYKDERPVSEKGSKWDLKRSRRRKARFDRDNLDQPLRQAAKDDYVSPDFKHV